MFVTSIYRHWFPETLMVEGENHLPHQNCHVACLSLTWIHTIAMPYVHSQTLSFVSESVCKIYSNVTLCSPTHAGGFRTFSWTPVSLLVKAGLALQSPPSLVMVVPVQLGLEAVPFICQSPASRARKSLWALLDRWQRKLEWPCSPHQYV